MRLLTVVGTRPQFVKAAVVGRALRERHREILVHTGQHYDPGLSDVFFQELGLPAPAYALGVGSGSHADQTARMLPGIEAAVLAEKPDAVLVYGDTNSALAGALVAAKLAVPVAHIEAGCRSFERTLPEEINRVIVDHVSRWLFCPTRLAVENLVREGVREGVHCVGDVMLDLSKRSAPSVARRGELLAQLGVEPGRYLLATVHRAANTEEPRLRAILDGLADLSETVVFPLHPRTRRALGSLGHRSDRLRFIDPVGYLDMQLLIGRARMVLTDSGGVQKEAFFLGTPCVTLREATEWTETVDAGWDRLVGTEPGAIADVVGTWSPVGALAVGIFGDGHAAERIVDVLEAAL